MPQHIIHIQIVPGSSRCLVVGIFGEKGTICSHLKDQWYICIYKLVVKTIRNLRHNFSNISHFQKFSSRTTSLANSLGKKKHVFSGTRVQNTWVVGDSQEGFKHLYLEDELPGLVSVVRIPPQFITNWWFQPI